MGGLIDLMSQRSGRLTVIARADNTPKGQARWLCRCDCGKETIVQSNRLVSNSKRPTLSCGCYNSDCTAIRNTTHGASVDPNRKYLFETWQGIKKRCFNPKSTRYQFYGGRGITMASEWINDYVAFESYILQELGHKPTSQHSIDRIDNDGDYQPGNVRWATKREQIKNRRPVDVRNSYKRHFDEVPTATAAELVNQLKSRGLLLQDIAAKLGVSRAAVKTWLSGRSWPQGTTFRRLWILASCPDGDSCHYEWAGDSPPLPCPHCEELKETND